MNRGTAAAERDCLIDNERRLRQLLSQIKCILSEYCTHCN